MRNVMINDDGDPRGIRIPRLNSLRNATSGSETDMSSRGNHADDWTQITNLSDVPATDDVPTLVFRRLRDSLDDLSVVAVAGFGQQT